jgi:hypothetical protein
LSRFAIAAAIRSSTLCPFTVATTAVAEAADAFNLLRVPFLLPAAGLLAGGYAAGKLACNEGERSQNADVALAETLAFGNLRLG